MTSPENENGTPEEQEAEGLHISDKRRFDPETYARRQAPEPTEAASEPAGATPQAGPGPEPESEADEEGDGEIPGDFVVPDDISGLESDTRVAELENQVRERTQDLQRLQAEYVNYKRRVDRDRDLARQGGIETVMTDILAVLDDLQAARAHEDLSGGFKAVAEEIEKVAAKHGLSAYGTEGEPFDPQVHEALMHQPAPEGTELEGPVVAAVLQPGYRLGERILRPARVAVTGA
ncbi:molecular chaperone GrpE [Raineyella antarctica]|uniref:Protein GrpE n=1 Tax=Raineyella antarctica TaxID=1577474 RepID=A0A1G6H965_9ACTN|nr:nucleotide exchange factor GrpE [Raineyella antarctica]SDB89976.1 molecular chaperone GrpE [Raineyella antarctica]